METKKCTFCGDIKEIYDFYSHKLSKDGYRPECKRCTRNSANEFIRRKKLGLVSLAKENKIKKLGENYSFEEMERSVRYKYIYGIDLKEYNELFNKQGGFCAICGEHQINLKRKLGIDHNHETGKVRGLLCPNCNHGIGKLKDSSIILRKAADYLDNNN